MKKLSICLLICLLTGTISRAHYPSLSGSSATGIVADIKEYVGEYTFTTSGSPISTFYITEKEGELYGEADSYGANKLIKQTDADKYVSTSSYGSTIIFTRHPDTKKVSGLQLIIQGNTLEADKKN